MSKQIDRKWVRESKRTFSEFPSIPRSGTLGEEETWLELAQFYRDDLRWLLSLDHHKFWSHMIFAENTNELLVSFLKKSLPNSIKNTFLVREDMRIIFKEIEHLIFLAFLRLSTEKESGSCFVRNYREVIYNNYLFTVPVILDICLIYGASNHELVKKMINNIVTSAPEFLDDFQEIIPHFVHVLKTAKHRLSTFQSSTCSEENMAEVQDLIFYLGDAVATIQVFFELYPNVCQLFSKAEVLTEIMFFYSSVLPEILNYWLEKQPNEKELECTLMENIRVDLIKIVKTILDFVLIESREILEKKEDSVNQYLSLLMKLVDEPYFLSDYNLMYPIEFEIDSALKSSHNVNLVQVNQILEGVAIAISGDQENVENFKCVEVDESGVKFDSLVTEVKDIFPHLEENCIKQYLNYYNNSTERVVAAVLENLIPSKLDERETKNLKSEGMLAFKGKHKTKHKDFNEMLEDREEITKIKERYAELSVTTDETYDDEYDDEFDDAYDVNMDVSSRDGEESGQRPFVIPRVLRTRDEPEEETEEEKEEQEENETEDNSGRDEFVANPAVAREQMMRKRLQRSKRDVEGRGRGQGQSKQVLKNREFKEAHKSHMANHNRKRQAGRKMAKGMIPS